MMTKEQADVTRVLIHTVFDQFAKQSLAVIPKYTIHKVLFLAKDEIPDNHLIRDMAFFWYRYGPISDQVSDEIRSMGKKSLIRSRANGCALDGESHLPASITGDPAFQEARDTITAIVGSGQPGDILKRVYADPAHPWYIDYKKFHDEFKRYVYFSDEDVYTSNDTVLDSFYQTFPAVPRDEGFRQFYLTYYAFSRIFIPLIENYSPYKYREIFEILNSLIEGIWNAFAYYAAIMHHDPSYDDRVEGWKLICDSDLLALQERIEDLEDIIDQKYDEPDAEPAESAVDMSGRIYTPDELIEKIDQRLGR